MARGIVSAEGEEQQAGRLQHPVDVPAAEARPAAQVRGAPRAAGEYGDNEDRQRHQRGAEEHAGDRGGPRDAAVVQGGDPDHRRQGHGAAQPARPAHGVRQKVSAIAAQDATLPMTKAQPARNPHHSPSRSRP